MEIKPDTNVAEALKMSKKVANVFRKYNMDCPGCKGVSQETIGRAAFNNGLPVDEFVKELNDALK